MLKSCFRSSMSTSEAHPRSSTMESPSARHRSEDIPATTRSRWFRCTQRKMVAFLIFGMTTLFVGWLSGTTARADIITSFDRVTLNHDTPWPGDEVKVYATLSRPDYFTCLDVWQAWNTTFTLTPLGSGEAVDQERVIVKWMEGGADAAFSAFNPVYSDWSMTGNTWSGSISFNNSLCSGDFPSHNLLYGKHLIGTLQISYADLAAIDPEDYGTYRLGLEEGGSVSAAIRFSSGGARTTTPMADSECGSTDLTLTPEPATYAMFTGIGIVGLAWYRRKQHAKKNS